MSAPTPPSVVPAAAATAASEFPAGPLQLNDLLQALARDGLIPLGSINTLSAEIRSAHRDAHPLNAVAELRLKSARPPHKPITIELLLEWLAEQAQLAKVNIDPLKIDFTRVSDIMSDAYAMRFRILPIDTTPTEVIVATAEPFWRDWMEEISHITRKNVRCVLADPLDIRRYTAEFYNLARSVKRASAQGNSAAALSSNFEQLVQLGRSGRQVDANDQHIVHIVDWLWQYAFDQRASDIHLEPRRELGIVRFRIDGVLHQVYQVPAAVMGAMIARVKLLGRMDVVERRRPQDGRIKTRNMAGEEVELRLSTLPTAFGEKLVMRIFDPDVVLRDLAELGFPADDAARWETITQRSNGIILVTGPTGSGKTSTLYATLKRLATEAVNVCTVEDPIEMMEPSFNQMQVQHGIDLDFADGLRALMRQDPDIIMVGEIRDLETADMAIQAALTGHLVFSTLHTNDAPSAITRLLELGVKPYLIGATVLGVLAQRLVRTLCPHCRKPAAPLEPALWRGLITPWKSDRLPTTFEPVGCLECRMTGYRGRSGIYELLVMSDTLHKLIDQSPDLPRIRRQAMQDGMRPLRVSAALKIADGTTAVTEALTVVSPELPENLKPTTPPVIPPDLTL